MKKVITLTICTIISSALLAQTEHLKFKGVPIDGTLSEYITALSDQGFILLEKDGNIGALEGDFAGYKDCIIFVSTLDNKDLVNTITVKFPDCDTWSSLYGCYSNLKEMLTEKYGEPSECVEYFDSSYQPGDDREKLYFVGFDNCKYQAVFSQLNGSIVLSIEHNSTISYFVLLQYYDKTNSEIIREHAINDL